MHPEKALALEHRVVSAAEAALAHHHYVSAIDVLTGMGLLAQAHVEDWRKGRIDFLERVIHTNLPKVSLCMAAFRRFAQARGLKPSETGYVRRDRGGTVNLRFSKSGDPNIERSYRTHFVAPDIPERKKQQMEERLSRPPERVAFLILRDSRCSECGIELERGSPANRSAKRWRRRSRHGEGLRAGAKWSKMGQADPFPAFPAKWHPLDN